MNVFKYLNFNSLKKIRNIVCIMVLPIFTVLVIVTSIGNCGKVEPSVPEPDLENFAIDELTTEQIVRK